MAIEIQIRVTIENPPEGYLSQKELAEFLKGWAVRAASIDRYEVSQSSSEVVNILDNEIAA